MPDRRVLLGAAAGACDVVVVVAVGVVAVLCVVAGLESPPPPPPPQPVKVIARHTNDIAVSFVWMCFNLSSPFVFVRTCGRSNGGQSSIVDGWSTPSREPHSHQTLGSGLCVNEHAEMN